MLFRKPRLVAAVGTGTAVLVVAVTLLVSRGVIDALVLVLIVAALAGAYRLRRYARDELVYRRRAKARGVLPRTALESEPVGSGSAQRPPPSR